MRYNRVGISATRDDFHTIVRLAFRGYRDDEKGQTKPFTIRFSEEEVKEAFYFDNFDPETGINLTNDDAQNLLDRLYALGFRPTQEGTAGQLAAVQFHLKDMRDLAFSLKEELVNANHVLNVLVRAQDEKINHLMRKEPE